MTELLLVVLLLLAILALILPSVFAGVIILAVFSLGSALFFFPLHAPDLAVAEAAVGAGLATFIFVYTVRRTETDGDP